MSLDAKTNNEETEQTNQAAEFADQSVGKTTESTDSSTLEEKVSAGLAELRDKESGSTEDEEEVFSDTDETETKTEDESAEKEADSSDEEKEAADSDAEESPTLPAGHRRAALARGWADEEINHFLQTKPDEAVAKFEELFDKWQVESSRWSTRGRALLKADDAGTNLSASEAQAKEKTKEALSPIDVEALIEKHGNEDLINDLVGPLNKTIDRINSTASQLAQSQEFVKNSEAETLATEAQNFLLSEEMKSFTDVYGTDVKTLTDEQLQKRMELFGEADIIVCGALDHGKNLTVQEALERAHAITSRDSTDERIRKSIRESMEKRTKTTKSTHQKTSTSNDDGPVTEDELIKRTKERMKVINNSS